MGKVLVGYPLEANGKVIDTKKQMVVLAFDGSTTGLVNAVIAQYGGNLAGLSNYAWTVEGASVKDRGQK